MTAKDWRKMFESIKHKKAEREKMLKFNKPKERKYGRGTRHCIICHRTKGIIRRYGLNMCRQCFRDLAEKLGFKKYN